MNLLRRLKAHRVTCGNCEYCKSVYLTTYDGSGIYKAATCEFSIVDKHIVDPRLRLSCANYKKLVIVVR